MTTPKTNSGCTRLARAICLLCSLMLLAGCGKTIDIKTYIDGADTIKIQGNKVWYVHEEWDLPGKWQGHQAPTMINGKPWNPVWHDKISEPYAGLEPFFAPLYPADIKLKKRLGRGEVTISELPSPQNNQTLSIHIFDEPPGADWYEVVIKWK